MRQNNKFILNMLILQLITMLLIGLVLTLEIYFLKVNIRDVVCPSFLPEQQDKFKDYMEFNSSPLANYAYYSKAVVKRI